MPNYILGMNAKAYFGEAVLTGQDDAAVIARTWTELDNIKDLSVNLETGEADVTTRANAGWKATAATLKDGTVEWTMQWKTSDAGFLAVQTAWLNATELSLLVLDGSRSVSGNQGLASNFTITNFSVNQPNEEAITVSVTAKPSSQQQWYTVGS